MSLRLEFATVPALKALNVFYVSLAADSETFSFKSTNTKLHAIEGEQLSQNLRGFKNFSGGQRCEWKGHLVISPYLLADLLSIKPLHVKTSRFLIHVFLTSKVSLHESGAEK